MTKMTYAQALEIAIASVADEVAVERLEALKAQLAKRNSGERKPTKTQKENEVIKGRILEVLTAEGRQCKDIASDVGISINKASALLKQLVESGLAEKYIEKRVTYFKAVEG